MVASLHNFYLPWKQADSEVCIAEDVVDSITWTLALMWPLTTLETFLSTISFSMDL